MEFTANETCLFIGFSEVNTNWKRDMTLTTNIKIKTNTLFLVLKSI